MKLELEIFLNFFSETKSFGMTENKQIFKFPGCKQPYFLKFKNIKNPKTRNVPALIIQEQAELLLSAQVYVKERDNRL